MGQKEQKNYETDRKKMNKMAIVNPYLSIITSHANGFAPPVKIYRVAECIKKEDSTICWGMYRTFYTTVAECIYSSQVHMKYF